MSESSVLEATGIPEAPLTKDSNPKIRATFAFSPRELRDKIYEQMVTGKIVCSRLWLPRGVGDNEGCLCDLFFVSACPGRSTGLAH